MVIDGYIAALVSLGDLPQQQPLVRYPPEEQQKLADQPYNRGSGRMSDEPQRGTRGFYMRLILARERTETSTLNTCYVAHS